MIVTEKVLEALSAIQIIWKEDYYCFPKSDGVLVHFCGKRNTLLGVGVVVFGFLERIANL